MLVLLFCLSGTAGMATVSADRHAPGPAGHTSETVVTGTDESYAALHEMLRETLRGDVAPFQGICNARVVLPLFRTSVHARVGSLSFVSEMEILTDCRRCFREQSHKISDYLAVQAFSGYYLFGLCKIII